MISPNLGIIPWIIGELSVYRESRQTDRQTNKQTYYKQTNIQTTSSFL